VTVGARGRAGSPTETGFQPHLGSHLPSVLACVVFRHFWPPLRQQCHVCVGRAGVRVGIVSIGK